MAEDDARGDAMLGDSVRGDGMLGGAPRGGRLRDEVRAALLDAVALVLPVDCVGCGAPDRTLCEDCRLELRPRVIHRSVAGTPVLSGLAYAGVAQRAILALKSGRTGLARALAPALAASVAAAADATAPGEPIELCPVPTSRRAYRRRGFDPVRLLLARAGLVPARPFRTARSSADQKTLDVAARAENLHDAFRLRRPVDGRILLLVDDVVTSGATLARAAAVLGAAGAQVVGAATVASTPRRVPSQGTLGPG